MSSDQSTVPKSGAHVLFRKGQAVRFNVAGREAQLNISGTNVWCIGKVIFVPENPVHPARYELEPPHPFGAISGMFLELATACDKAG